MPVDESPVWKDAAAWLDRRCQGLVAVLAHGPLARGESLPGASLDWLLITRYAGHVPEAGLPELIVHLQRATGLLCAVQVCESYRLGWLPPSVFQQSLLSSAILLAGDPAAVRTIPSWRPGEIDPRHALSELERAARAMASGFPALAASLATGALLVAKRAYTPWRARQRGAFAAAWPELIPPAEDAGAGAASAWLSVAQHAIHDWLFTWEGEGPGSPAIERYVALWQHSVSATRR